MAYKHDYDRTLFRLTNIIAKLYNGAKLTNSELAQEFNVSTKTIQRDFVKLVALYPIYKDGRKWSLQKEYNFDEKLSLEDDITIKLLSNVSKSFDKSFSQRADKLLQRVNENINSPIYTKIELEDISNKLSEIKDIETAINSSQTIILTYLKDEHYFEVELEPYKIVNFEGFWYLVGKNRGVLKKYYLQNVFDIELLDKKYRVSKKALKSIENALNIWFSEDTNISIKLLIDKSIMKYFQRKPISQTQRFIDLDNDGNMIVSIDISNENEIIPIVKYWLPNIKIIEPIELNEKIKKEIEKFLKWT